MKSSTRWHIIGWPCALILIFVLLPIFLPPARLRREFSPFEKDISLIRQALGQYAIEHEHYPYDERGPGYALYKLKPYLTNFPTIMPAEIWNDKEQRLDTMPFGYVNEALCIPFEQSSKLLLWVPLKDGANLCVLRSGNTGYGFPGEPFGE